jgi:hypothetical protein
LNGRKTSLALASLTIIISAHSHAGAFLLVTWVATQALFFFLHESSIPLNASSQSASFLPGIQSDANPAAIAATLADHVVGSNTAITASPIPAL